MSSKQCISLRFLCTNCHNPLLRANVLELLVGVQEVVGVCLWHSLSLIWLLDEVLVTLLLSKGDRILSRLEVHAHALHDIGGRLPSHKWVLPSVSLWQDIPIHAPVVCVPISGLCGSLRRAEDAVLLLAGFRSYRHI